MANKKFRILGLISATVIILFITGAIGYFISSRMVVAKSKTPGKLLRHLPETISILETDFIGLTGIHFRGKTGKLYRCDNPKETCQTISPEPPRYDDDSPFRETQESYRKFSLPFPQTKQIVFSRVRGLVGHQTVRQYALLEDGRVWFWIYSGNEMGDSFPFWHLNNWIELAIGTMIGLAAGFVISALIWIGLYPRS